MIKRFKNFLKKEVRQKENKLYNDIINNILCSQENLIISKYRSIFSIPLEYDIIEELVNSATETEKLFYNKETSFYVSIERDLDDNKLFYIDYIEIVTKYDKSIIKNFLRKKKNACN